MSDASWDIDVRDQSPRDKRKRTRRWTQITGITLHQTGVHGFGVGAWPRVTCHIGVHSDGRVFYVHPLQSLLWASNAFNRDTVAIEVAGNFRGDEVRESSYWTQGGGPSQLTEPMIAGLQRAIRFIVAEVARNSGAITEVFAHRQALRGKSLCPGEQVWKAGGVWAQRELGLSNGGPGYTRSTGRPIPPAWDPSVLDDPGPVDFADTDAYAFDPEESAAEDDHEFSDASGDELGLLLVHGDAHTPALEDLSDLPVPTDGEQLELPDMLDNRGVDPNLLDAQRWGVIAPVGSRGDELLTLIAPLIEHRATQQRAAVRIFRVPPQQTAAEASVWNKKEFDRKAELADELPRYLLVLGDLHEVSLALQQTLSNNRYVGRLAFDTDTDYVVYIDKLLRWERAASHGRAAAVLHAVNDGTLATTLGDERLVQPGAALLRGGMAAGTVLAEEVALTGDAEPAPQQLLDAAGRERPTVLFSLSHGHGPPSGGGWADVAQMRAYQGAMSFGKNLRLSGDELARGTFLPGGVWFMFACFSAGTPTDSVYARWLRELQAEGKYFGSIDRVLDALAGERTQPFIAAIPKRVLANPDGPLAFIGHADLAWSYSFQDYDAGVKPRPARFATVLRDILAGHRVGVAFDEISRGIQDVNQELTARLEAITNASAVPSATRVRLAHLWMLRNDLAAFILLGDPATRLSVAPTQADAEAAPVPPAPSELPSLEQIEAAVLRVLVDPSALTSAAGDLDLATSELQRLATAYQAAGRATLPASQ